MDLVALVDIKELRGELRDKLLGEAEVGMRWGGTPRNWRGIGGVAGI